MEAENKAQVWQFLKSKVLASDKYGTGDHRRIHYRPHELHVAVRTFTREAKALKQSSQKDGRGFTHKRYKHRRKAPSRNSTSHWLYHSPGGHAQFLQMQPKASGLMCSLEDEISEETLKYILLAGSSTVNDPQKENFLKSGVATDTGKAFPLLRSFSQP